MSIELVIYLCIGIASMIAVIAGDWFLADRLSGQGIGIGLLAIVFWPLFGICLIGGLIAALFEEDFVIARRKK